MSDPLSSEADFADNLVNFSEDDLIVHDRQLGDCNIPCTLTQMRIIILALSKVETEDNGFKPIAFTRSEFMRVLGLEGHIYTGREFRKLLADETMSLKLHYTRYHRRWGKGKGVRQIFSQCEYFESAGIVGLKFNSDMTEFFLGLKREFTSYRLRNVIGCGSLHTIRMYMLLRARLGLRNGEGFTVEQLRTTLDLEDTAYPEVRTLKRSVIAPALKYINANTDISVDCTPLKEGRRTAGFKFRVSPNTSQSAARRERQLQEEDAPMLPGFMESLG